jgi:hypothetical protein
MALRHIRRSRVPLDGRWFRTEARLQSIMREAARYDDEMSWPGFVQDTWVPIWVRMEAHEGEKTPTNPEGTYYHPIVKVGCLSISPEVKPSSPHSAGLFKDSNLDGWDHENKWIYRVFESDRLLGEDASVYACDQCKHHLHRDDLGLRHSHSACLFDGGLVCRDCEYLGAIIPAEVRDRLSLCRTLADVIGPACRENLEGQVSALSRVESWCKPAQTRWFLDSHKWSFVWSERVLTDDGWKPSLHGGLIQHGPRPVLGEGGAFAFTTWDYAEKKERPATEDEIKGIYWGIHT